jgi:hypothetical protein
VNWSLDGFSALSAIVGAPETIYLVGDFFGAAPSAPALFRITSR